ncbi:MAG: response regulator [Fibrobacter sp.]|nr:response regulator [Fibrobacter sp.]
MIHKILIVDDSPVARKMLKSCLPKDRELDIYEASNGEEGIEIFKKVTPDLTFLDLTMPVLDGYKTIPLLKQLDSDVVIIVLTADVQPKSISQVLSLGAFTLLKKPATSQSIQDALKQAEIKI